MKKYLNFDLQTADRAGATKHPQHVMQDLGITYQKAVPQSMSDSWQFWNCENIPDPLPEYLTAHEGDPMEYIGYGLSREMAEAIRDYTNTQPT